MSLTLAQSDAQFFAWQTTHADDVRPAPVTADRCPDCDGPMVWDGFDGQRDYFACADGIRCGL